MIFQFINKLFILSHFLAFSAAYLENLDLTSPNPSKFTSLFGSSPNYHFGYSVSNAGDFNGDGIDDIIIGAPPLTSAGIPGTNFLIYGQKNGISDLNLASGLTSNQGFAITGYVANDGFGWSVSRAGDVNGDGLSDVIIGGPTFGGGSGGAAIIFGSRSITSTVDLSSTGLGSNGFIYVGVDASSNTGISVSGAGDINDDGLDDFIIGASGANSYTGSAYVIFGKNTYSSLNSLPTNAAPMDNTLGFRIKGDSPYRYFGGSVGGAGDINGDGISDIIIGAVSFDAGNRPSSPGIAYVIYGRRTGITDIDLASGLDPTKGFWIQGVNAMDRLGGSVSGIGDINGDSIDDIVIGAFGGDPPGRNNAGIVYVIYGRKGLFPNINLAMGLSSDQGFKIFGASATDRLGYSVRSAGDINNDGVNDIIVGALKAPAGGTTFPAVSYVIFGNKVKLSDIDLANELDSTQGFKIQFLGPSDVLASPISVAGDFNADGTSDLLIGSSQNNHPILGTQTGSAYIVSGLTFPERGLLQTLVDVKEPMLSSIHLIAMVMSLLYFSNATTLWFSFLAEILYYVRYLDIRYPRRLRYILEQPDPEFISIKYISSIPEEFENRIPGYSIPEKFEMYGFSSNFLVNFWPSLIMLMIIITLIIIVSVLEYSSRSMKKIHSKCQKVKQALKWNYLISIFIGYFCDIALFTSLDLKTNEFETNTEWASFFLCIIANLAVVLILIKMALVARKIVKVKSINKDKTNTQERINIKNRLKDYEVIFESFKDNSFFQQGYMMIFSLRLYIFYVIVAYLPEYPILQTVFVNLLGIAIILYLAFQRPFKDKKYFVSSIFQEVILQIVNISAFVLALTDGEATEVEDSARVAFGDIIIICNVIFIIIGLISILILIITSLKDLYAWIKNRNIKKKTTPSIIPLHSTNIKNDTTNLSMSSEFNLVNDSAISFDNSPSPHFSQMNTRKQNRFSKNGEFSQERPRLPKPVNARRPPEVSNDHLQWHRRNSPTTKLALQNQRNGTGSYR